ATFTTANATAGTKIIAAVGCFLNGHAASVITSVQDAASNPLTLIGRVTTGTTMDVSLWAMDTPAGDVGIKPAITVTATAGLGISLVVQEVSGLLAGNTTAMCDGTLASNSGTGGASTGSPTYSSTASSEYLVSMYGDDGGPETWTKPAALTADPNDINSNSFATAAIAYGNSTGGAESASWALTGTATNWGTLLVAFKLAAGGGAAASITGQAQPGATWHRRFHHRQQVVPPSPSAAPSAPLPSGPVPLVARLPQPRRGHGCHSPGAVAGTGPPVKPQPGPVRARLPQPQRKGRACCNHGVCSGHGPRVTPLPRPVRAPVPPPSLHGRVQHSSGTFSGTGPKIKAPPVTRVRPAVPPRGQVRSNPGAVTAAAPI